MVPWLGGGGPAATSSPHEEQLLGVEHCEADHDARHNHHEHPDRDEVRLTRHHSSVLGTAPGRGRASASAKDLPPSSAQSSASNRPWASSASRCVIRSPTRPP